MPTLLGGESLKNYTALNILHAMRPKLKLHRQVDRRNGCVTAHIIAASTGS
jgi:hypothetical protein